MMMMMMTFDGNFCETRELYTLTYSLFHTWRSGKKDLKTGLPKTLSQNRSRQKIVFSPVKFDDGNPKKLSDIVTYGSDLYSIWMLRLLLLLLLLRLQPLFWKVITSYCFGHQNDCTTLFITFYFGMVECYLYSCLKCLVTFTFDLLCFNWQILFRFDGAILFQDSH